MKSRSMIPLCMVLMAVASPAALDDFTEHLLAAQQLFGQGDYGGAEKILLAALREADGFAADDARRAIVWNNLGSVYQFLDRYPQAEQCYRRAVEIEGRLWGTAEDKPYRSVLNLAALYIENGQYEKAERLGLRALVGHGPARRSDPDFARLLGLVADLEEHQGLYGKALEYDEQALAIFEDLAPTGRQTMDTLNNLCLLYKVSGRGADALSSCKLALRIAESTPNLEPAMRALLLANVGTLEVLAHGPAEAEPFYAKSLAIAESGLGRDHALFGRILLSYADLLERTNRKTEARQCRRRAKAILEAASRTDSTKYTVDLGDLLKRESRR